MTQIPYQLLFNQRLMTFFRAGDDVLQSTAYAQFQNLALLSRVFFFLQFYVNDVT